MTKIFSLLLTSFICLTTSGQNIKLTQIKLKDDIEIVNGVYHLFVKRTDIVNSINKIDKTLKTDNTALVQAIQTKKNNTVILSSKDEKDKKFIDLIKSNIGVYLLLQGKVTIFKNNTQIKSIVADESPEMVDFNGNATRRIFFSEVNSDIEIFLGDMNLKIEQEKK